MSLPTLRIINNALQILFPPTLFLYFFFKNVTIYNSRKRNIHTGRGVYQNQALVNAELNSLLKK